MVNLLENKEEVSEKTQLSDYSPSTGSNFEKSDVSSVYEESAKNHMELCQWPTSYERTGETREIDTDTKITRPVPTGYSVLYIQMKTRELISFLLQELSAWHKNGTNDSLANISAMKNAIASKFNYLSQDSNFRLFVSTLRLVIGKWETLDSVQIEALHNHLNNYADGQISSGDTKNFNKFLFENGISLFN